MLNLTRDNAKNHQPRTTRNNWKTSKIIYSGFLFGLLAAILCLNGSVIQGQTTHRKSKRAGSTAPPNVAVAEVKSASSKKARPAAQTDKKTGWAVEVRSISSVFEPYVGFNSTGLAIVLRRLYSNSSYFPGAGKQCQFNMSEKLLREAQSLLARIQPQNWKQGYGDKSQIAFRVTLTVHKSVGPSAVYETWWKGATDYPDDLRQVFRLKDKVLAENFQQCK